jgi:hypothetical protein
LLFCTLTDAITLITLDLIWCMFHFFFIVSNYIYLYMSYILYECEEYFFLFFRFFGFFLRRGKIITTVRCVKTRNIVDRHCNGNYFAYDRLSSTNWILKRSFSLYPIPHIHPPTNVCVTSARVMQYTCEWLSHHRSSDVPSGKMTRDANPATATDGIWKPLFV